MAEFTQELSEPIRVLDFEGHVDYLGLIFSACVADELHAQLNKRIKWTRDEMFIYGRHIISKRKTAWYGDKPFLYTYSKKMKIALPWTNELVGLRMIVEQITQESFNSCLLNLYDNGGIGIAWHSDDENELRKCGTICTLSLGAERKINFKHKRSNEMLSVDLQNGSLLVMKGTTQANWLHCLPKIKKLRASRISLTFRNITQTCDI